MTEINNIIQVNTIVNEAKQAAREAAEKFFQEKLGGKEYQERYDTPRFCSPSSESYWSM